MLEQKPNSELKVETLDSSSPNSINTNVVGSQSQGTLKESVLIRRMAAINKKMPKGIAINSPVVDRMYSQFKALMSSRNSTESLPSS